MDDENDALPDYGDLSGDTQAEIAFMDDDDDGDVTENEDGSATIRVSEDDEDERTPDFYRNLAEDMSEGELGDIAAEYLDLIERDREARKKRDEQYEDGIRRTGLGDDAPGGAQFQGASRVVHPMLTEACIDFASRAMKELMPPKGPVKDLIVGDVTVEKVQKAKRKTELMNWQLTVQSTEFRAELEQLLTQVPLGGAQYLKTTWDNSRNRPQFLFVAIDDMYLPFAATNFYSAQRKTHVQYLTTLDYDRKVKSGMYRDIDVIPPGSEPERSDVDKANDKIEGRSESSYNEDGLRTVFEIYATTTLDDDDEASPYIISVDKTSRTVLSIYRNWDELDETREELQWFVEFPFIPWRGAYPIGLPHIMGGLSAAATGALRALMDSAHIQNAPTMLKLKGGSRGGQSLNIQPTQVEEIEGGLNIDDIRKIAMPLPFNPPSQILMELLGFITDAAKGVVRTSMEDVASEMQADTPVGTTLARMEQGMVVFSAIHARLHDAMARLLRVLHRLNGMYLDDADIEHEIGQELATRGDFEGPLDVVPVSDPNIFSEAQRYAQVQAVAQRSQIVPQLYDLRKVEQRILETLKIPNPLELLAPTTEPKEQNAVNENVTATMGHTILAFPEQDHIAHLKAHLSYMLNPALGSSPLIAPVYIPIMLNHIKEHIAFWYASGVFQLGNEVSGGNIAEDMRDMKDPKDRQAFDRMLAEASQTVSEEAQAVFTQLPAAIKQAQQTLQQFMPPPQMDPAVQVAQQQVQMQDRNNQQRNQIEQQKLAQAAEQAQTQAQLSQTKAATQAQQTQTKLDQAAQNSLRNAAIEAAKEHAVDERERMDMDARAAMNTQDNSTSVQIALMDHAHAQAMEAYKPEPTKLPE